MNTTITPQLSPADKAVSATQAALLSRLGRYERNPGVVVAEIGVIVGLAATAYIHLKEMSSKFAEVPYLGVGYAFIAAGCFAAIAMIVARNKAGWYLGGATALATFIGFVLTRTVGLPGSTDDIGNWGETIAIQSLVAEGLVIAITALMIAVYFRKGRTATR
ncbi:MAG: threonine/homoserine efflux transporter RhtA [Ilumatobacter sp.]|jgi:threonine/homoserine efflux transporter RhtA